MASLINAAPSLFEPPAGSDDVSPRASLLNGTTPLAAPPTQADAWEATNKAYADWVAAQRADAVAKGFVDPQTGELTKAGQQQQALSIDLGFVGDGLEAAPMRGLAAKLDGAAMPAGEHLIDSEMKSRLKMSYKPPDVVPRPFEADYPGGAPVDGSGNLTQTVDGQPVTARYVVGRRALQQPDVALTPQGVNAVSEGLFGATPTPVAGKSIAGDAGRLSPAADPITGDPAFKLVFNKSLPQGVRDDAIAHEVAHGIDYLARTIPQTGIKNELGAVYHALNSPQPIANGLSTPQNLYGYTDAQAPKELMAEAVRAYMQNPNYLKSVAPNVAARIRDAVNTNPMLSRWIQFNSAVGLGGGAAASSTQPTAVQPGVRDQ